MQERDIELIKDEPLQQKLIKKWFWLYFFGYLSAPLWYVIRVIISNSPDVSVAEFWVLYGIISLVTLLYTYNDLWLTESLQYFLPRFYFRKQFDNIKTTIYFSLFIEFITGIIIALWLRFGSDWLAAHYFKSESASEILRYFCFYFFGMNILQVIQAIFKSLQKTFESKCIEFIQVLSIAIFTLCFFFLWWDIQQYSLSRILWVGIAIFFALILYSRYRKTIMKWTFKVDKTILKQYTKYAVWALLWNSIWNIFGQIILQMVLYFLWAESAGYYSNFLSLYSIWITVLRQIKTLIYPLISEYHENSNTHAIEKLITIFYSYFPIIILSFSVLLVVFWPEISVILFWEKYLLSGVLLSYAGMFLIFNLLSSFNYQILTWLWKVKDRVHTISISCILTIIIALIWIKIWGIYWAVISFGLSNVVNRVLSLYALKKENYKIKVKRSFIVKNIIILIILWIVIFLVKHQIIWYTWNKLLLLLSLWVISIIFYLVLLIANKNEIIHIKNAYKKAGEMPKFL